MTFLRIFGFMIYMFVAVGLLITSGAAAYFFWQHLVGQPWGVVCGVVQFLVGVAMIAALVSKNG